MGEIGRAALISAHHLFTAPKISLPLLVDSEMEIGAIKLHPQQSAKWTVDSEISDLLQ